MRMADTLFAPPDDFLASWDSLLQAEISPSGGRRCTCIGEFVSDIAKVFDLQAAGILTRAISLGAPFKAFDVLTAKTKPMSLKSLFSSGTPEAGALSASITASPHLSSFLYPHMAERANFAAEHYYIALRLPYQFAGHSSEFLSFMVLVFKPEQLGDPIPGQLRYENVWLYNLLNLRAGTISYHKEQLQVTRCKLPHVTGAEIQHLHQELGASLKALIGTVQQAELISIMKAATHGLDKSQEWFPEMIADLLDDGLSSWCDCSGLSCKCHSGAGRLELQQQRKIMTILAKWSWWINVTPSEVRNVRTIRNSPANKVAALLRSSETDIKGMCEDSLRLVHADELLPKSLFRCFFSKAFEPVDGSRQKLAANLAEADELSDEDVAQALDSIARIAHHLLADVPSDAETVKALMWLVSEYSHRTLGLPQRIDLRAHLLQAARGEPALHSLKNYYRDHFFHALEVCFLGHFLLDLRLGNKGKGKPLWEHVVEQLDIPEIKSKRRVLELWYLAALLHDVGYCIDIQVSLLEFLSFLDNSSVIEDFGANIRGALGALSGRLADEHFVEYEKSDEPGKDHGIVGAHHVYSLLKEIAKDDRSVKLDEYSPAIRAIALHNSRKHRVSFKKDPLAFLLILCDTIQEWNRPRLDFASAPLKMISRLLESGAKEEDFTGPLSSVRVNAELNTKTGAFFLTNPPGKRHLQFILGYEEEIQNNAGVFNLWLDASYNFQRLDFEGLPADLDIDVEYVTPLRSDPKGSQRQMYRLRDAARDTHMGFLEKWFPDQPWKDVSGADGLTNEAVSYSVRSEANVEKWEHLTLNLRKLSDSKGQRLTRDIGVFRDHLKKWKHYQDDQEFKDDYAAPKMPH